MPLNVLLVADGSGGHLIPALRVAERLAQSGAHIRVWYAQRQPFTRLISGLTPSVTAGDIQVDPMPVPASSNVFQRLWRCGQLWHRAHRCFETFGPDVVVGFGGWVTAPVVLAACARRTRLCWRRRRAPAARRPIRSVLHEQNVRMGRANRWLSRWVDRVAVSFHATQAALGGRPSVVTGLPIRRSIGTVSRRESAQQFGFHLDRPVLLVLGGSQGARAINRLMGQVAASASAAERETWQVIHLTGPCDEAAVRQAYASCGLKAWVAPFLVEMETAYALADLAIARAGASTIAELARCGIPAVLIPYPYAGGHQGANARLVESVGGGLVISESEATPERLLGDLRRFLGDARLRSIMGQQMRSLQCPDAADQLCHAILDVAGPRADRSA